MPTIHEAGQEVLDISFIVVHGSKLEQFGEEGAGQGEGVAEILEKVGIVGAVLKDGRVLDHEAFEQVVGGAGLVMGQRLEHGILDGAGIAGPLIDLAKSFHDGACHDRVVDIAELVD
jgi:hypothetical protein